MNSAANQALRIALVHETTSVVKQLQAELRREKAAHKRTRDEYEDLKSAAPDWASYCKYHMYQCAHCRKWSWTHESDWPEMTSVVHFKDGTCTSEELTWCTDCEQHKRESPWDSYCIEYYGHSGLREYCDNGKLLAAVLIQLAWKRYKGEFEERNESEEEEEENESEEEEESESDWVESDDEADSDSDDEADSNSEADSDAFFEADTSEEDDDQE